MIRNFNPIRDLILSFVMVIVLALAAWVAIDYGAAVIVAICGLTLVALAFPLLMMYEEEHNLPFNRTRRR